MANLLSDDETIIIAGGFENPELCYLLNKSEVPTKIVHLSSNQEEADTRIISTSCSGRNEFKQHYSCKVR